MEVLSQKINMWYDDESFIEVKMFKSDDDGEQLGKKKFNKNV